MWRQILAGAALWVVHLRHLRAELLRLHPVRQTPQFHRPAATSGASRSTCCSSAPSWWSSAGAQFKIDGTVIEMPLTSCRTIPNTLLSWSLASLVPPDPDHRSEPDGQLRGPHLRADQPVPKPAELPPGRRSVTAIGLVILPWNLYNSPVVINYFLGGLGALLGPLFGVIMADYWLLRRGKVNVPDALHRRPAGAYHYRGGSTRRPSRPSPCRAAVAVLLAFVPALHAVCPVRLVHRRRPRRRALFAHRRPHRTASKTWTARPSPSLRALTRTLLFQLISTRQSGRQHAHPRRQRQHHPLHHRIHR